jgi:hypothetical protein
MQHLASEVEGFLYLIILHLLYSFKVSASISTGVPDLSHIATLLGKSAHAFESLDIQKSVYLAFWFLIFY